MGELIMRASGDCTDGTCPTFWQDAVTGRWHLQGYLTDPGDSPAGEGRIDMSDEQFRHLIAQVR